MWDLFCKVVDNYGDIGVCWRLSRQLVAEHGAQVRLWVDDVSALARVWPGIDGEAPIQSSAGVEVRHWTEASTANVAPGDIVIEALGCEIRAGFIGMMATRARPPAWFNLEYLSAEDWVEGCHLLPSPHPRLPLTKYFYYPGFTPRTGGLLRESGLFAERDAFRRDEAPQDAFCQALGALPRRRGELRVSLFAYSNVAATTLFDAWASGTRPVTCLIPESVLTEEIRAYCGDALPPGATATRSALSLVRIPFLRQTDYDRLLWACDVNFVRGEDSFVRAQ